jgi:hypothetical protein
MMELLSRKLDDGTDEKDERKRIGIRGRWSSETSIQELSRNFRDENEGDQFFERSLDDKEKEAPKIK